MQLATGRSASRSRATRGFLGIRGEALEPRAAQMEVIEPKPGPRNKPKLMSGPW